MRSFWLPVVEISKHDYIFFSFNAICSNKILNENTDIFWKSQGLAALYVWNQQSYMIYKCENNQKWPSWTSGWVMHEAVALQNPWDNFPTTELLSSVKQENDCEKYEDEFVWENR